MIALFILATYFATVMGFCIWDAKVGFGFEWDGFDRPPLVLAAFFWPITLPYAFFMWFSKALTRAKKARLAREAEQEKIRVAAENDLAAALAQLESEESYETKATNRRGSGR